MRIFDNKETDYLIKAILTLESEEECKAFLEDVMTTKEILDMSQRIHVASLLKDKVVYSKISSLTGASAATISRVNRCINYGSGGYEKVLEKMEK
ncbi:MAG: YerC/YecD family TrpR-related protein [Oscillospiraceae bacterium]|nr:YerC/YecD family TrpR-related protein [Oscillospiraceae bacterium]MDD7354069.1 YerC/YecD family TrpR-related protein [Oscillospiraceae bacterium]